MKSIKKILACLFTSIFFINTVACSNQSWSVKSGDISLSMGTYICFLSEAYYEASSKLNPNSYASSYSTGQSILKEKIDDMDASEWIKEKAIEKCKNMIAIQKKFSELNLSLTEEETTKLQESTNQIWEKYGKRYEKLGVSKESYHKAAVLLGTQEEKIFKAIYGKDGTNAVSDEEIQEYFKSNNANVSIITKSLVKEVSSEKETEDDSDDIQSDNTENLTDEEIEAVKNKFENYASQINSGNKTIAQISESFKADEKLDKDPVITNTIPLENSYYPEDVIEAIKSLETGKAVAIKSEDSYYLILKNDISSELESLNEDEKRNSTLYEMKNEEFEKMISDWASENEYKINNGGINKHNPSIFESNVKKS